MRRLLMYRSELLAYSETFIASQAGAMRAFAPAFAGMRRVPNGIALPGPSWVVAEGRGLLAQARRYAFRRANLAPAWHRALRTWHPQLLHAHFATDAAEALPLAQLLRVPFVVTLHGYDVMAHDEAHRHAVRGQTYLARRRELFERAGLFLCVSEAIRARAIERGFPAEKLRVHPIGVELPAAPRFPLVPAEPLVLFVGRLVEKKGCRHLLRAMKQVQAALPQARLVVLGEGPERANLERQAWAERVPAEFLGAQGKAEVAQWMARARVLALPSITAADGDAEGLPTVLGEALAMGLPVAAFRSSGIPEMMRDGVEGLLAEERDEAALARNLLRICQDDALAARLGEAGRTRVASCFELHAQTRSLEAIYEELLAAQRRPVTRPATRPVTRPATRSSLRKDARPAQVAFDQASHGVRLPSLAAATANALDRDRPSGGDGDLPLLFNTSAPLRSGTRERRP